MSFRSLIQEYQSQATKQLQRAKKPNYRHGLNIQLRPKSLPERHDWQQGKLRLALRSTIPGIEVLAEERLLSQDGAAFQEYLDQNWAGEEDNDLFWWEQQARGNSWLFIHIGKEVQSDQPLELELTHEVGTLYSNIFVLAEAGSQAQILLNKKSAFDTPSYWGEQVRVLTAPNARVEIITVQNVDTQTVHWQDKKARLGRDSHVEWVEMNLGASYTRSHIISELQREGSSTQNTVLFLAHGDQQQDLYTASRHQAKNSYSNIVTKGVINNQAKALSRGLVHIGEEAWGSNGYEQQDALLLSEQAEADAIPNLEIHNHDVKCSHGSTVGQIDEAQLFYLMSRGLPKREAQNLIIEGYFTPVLDLLSSEDTRERIREEIRGALQHV